MAGTPVPVGGTDVAGAAGCDGAAAGTQPGEVVAGGVYGDWGATVGGAGQPGTGVAPGTMFGDGGYAGVPVAAGGAAPGQTGPTAGPVTGAEG